MTTRFEWDPTKAAVNLRKHGVSFELALRVFSDPFVLTALDRIEDGEMRWQAIGSLDSGSLNGMTVLLVVHTIREVDEDGQEIEIVRIISARKANRAEKRRYEEDSR